MRSGRLRHTKRYQEIVNAFLRNGFSHFLYRIGLADRHNRAETLNQAGNMNLQDVGVKLRRTLQELGPAFIKLGQMASSRRDFVPDEIAGELEKLQDEVEPIPYETVRAVVEQELGETIDQLFQAFSETPLATASIGQVHEARLSTGENVVVKVQRPNIQAKVEADLDILHSLSGLIESRIQWARDYHLRDRLDEFSDSLKEEMDYRIEGRNAERIGKEFQDNKTVRIPKIHWKYSAAKVLTMEKLEGIKVSNIESLESDGYDRKVIAQRLADSIFEQVLIEGFFHGDPHPGNIFIMPKNVIAYLDFGMVGRLSEEMRYHFASLLIQVRRGHTKGIVHTLSKMGLIEDESNAAFGLEKDIDTLIAKYYESSLVNISLGALLKEIFSIAYRHKVEVPSDITVLAKAVLTMEGIVSKLDPDFSIMQAVEPFGERLIRERYHPGNIARQAWSRLAEDTEMIASLPRDLKEIASLVKKGKLRLDIKLTDLETVLLRMDKISNRLSFSIILLAFSILMVGLIVGASIAGQTTLLLKLPIIEIGSVIAILMFLFMVFSIFRSGRM